jgi:uncharacterized membrane protein
MPNEVLIVDRWIHFVAGITWIGILYWFNLVNVRTMATIDATARPHVVTTLLPRALFWFRHSAWVTVLAGLILIYGLYWSHGDIVDSNGARTVFVGMLLGIAMLGNVWGVIYPNQKKVIAATRAATPVDPAWGRWTLYASRANVTMSFPMLFFMASSSHNPMDWAGIGLALVILAPLGFLSVYTVQKWWAPRF